VGCSLNTTERRIFLDASDYSIDHPKIDALEWHENCDVILCCQIASAGMYLCVWEDHGLEAPGLVTAWTTREYLDVTCQGAYIDMPWYWEE